MKTRPLRHQSSKSPRSLRFPQQKRINKTRAHHWHDLTKTLNFNEIPKINANFYAPQWDTYVKTAVAAHNTTYHQAIKCSLTAKVHGRVHFNSPDLKVINPIQAPLAKTDITTLIDQNDEK